MAALQFLAFTLLAVSAGAGWLEALKSMVRSTLARAFGFDATEAAATVLGRDLLFGMFTLLAPAGGLLLAVTLGVQLGVTGMGLSLKKLTPQLSRLNPAARLKELGRNNLPSLIQAALLLPLFGARGLGDRPRQPGPLPDAAASGRRSRRAPGGRITRRAAVESRRQCSWCSARVDLLRQRRRWQNDLRMSKQEVREELKEQEGNPQIKGRIRRLQRDAARRRMMQEVPTATAVIVNPTHYAVAMRYVIESMAAPVVVAKGKNYLARRIRERAIEHQVPIVENPPLAQALYKSVEVGQEIPAHLYRAVAEILAYIYRLMRGHGPGAGGRGPGAGVSRGLRPRR